jgi:hypothetical protein
VMLSMRPSRTDGGSQTASREEASANSLMAGCVTLGTGSVTRKSDKVTQKNGREGVELGNTRLVGSRRVSRCASRCERSWVGGEVIVVWSSSSSPTRAAPIASSGVSRVALEPGVMCAPVWR